MILHIILKYETYSICLLLCIEKRVNLWYYFIEEVFFRQYC